MNPSNRKEWLVRTKSREVMGPYSQSELIEQLNKNSFSVQDEICSNSGNWISASVLSSRDTEEVTRTSSRMTTHSIELTKSDLTPTPTSTDKISIPDPAQPSVKPAPSNRPLSKNQEALGTHATRQSAIRGPAKYPLLTAVILTFLTIFIFYRPQKPVRETSEVSTLSSGSNRGRIEETAIVKKAKSLLKIGRSKTALKLLANYHESEGKSDISHLTLYGALLITEGESAQRAKKLLEQALAAPNSNSYVKSQAHLWLGYLLLSQNEGDRGESHFLEALQLDPKDAAARFNLGRAYFKQKRFQQALDYLQLAELEQPDLWLIQVHKGWAKVALGLTSDASLTFKSAINLSKDRWVNYIYQAVFFTNEKVNNFEAAKQTMIAMLGRDPDYEKLSPIPFGYFQSSSINHKEYLEAYNVAMQTGTEEEKLIGKIYINYLASPMTRAEDWKKMDALANRSNNLLPRVLSLKMMLPNISDPVYLKTVLSKLPPNLDYFGPVAYVSRGQAREMLGNIAEAQLDYQKALTLDPTCATALWRQYELYKKLHRGPEARETLKSLLIAHPDFMPALAQSAELE
ncbi:MAG: hypothetical protein EBR01_05340 [Proteobacteria bacterium]|nr:hypothetical protein [Pseudomonadota bacterium]